jgi:hypothetical protein
VVLEVPYQLSYRLFGNIFDYTRQLNTGSS